MVMAIVNKTCLWISGIYYINIVIEWKQIAAFLTTIIVTNGLCDLTARNLSADILIYIRR